MNENELARELSENEFSDEEFLEIVRNNTELDYDTVLRRFSELEMAKTKLVLKRVSICLFVLGLIAVAIVMGN